jgi:peptide-methionine (S)-S-oxide reductase
METATFAAGCFWGVEARFRELDGVQDAEVGYTGGHTEDPTYEQVCSHRTGHAEAVRVQYDPGRITYEELVEAFFALHDPTQLNRQGPDLGDQYRSAIFAESPLQERVARQVKTRLMGTGTFRRPIVTEISPSGPFYRAEEYHQRYHEKHGRVLGRRGA